MSSQPPWRVAIFCWMSTPVESIFTPCSNSSTTMDTLFWLVELMCLISLRVAMACSMGLVMSLSTASGLAPGSVVTMTT